MSKVNEREYNQASYAHSLLITAAEQRKQQSAVLAHTRQIEFTVENASVEKLSVLAFTDSSVRQLGAALELHDIEIQLANQPLLVVNTDGTDALLGPQSVMTGTTLVALQCHKDQAQQISLQDPYDIELMMLGQNRPQAIDFSSIERQTVLFEWTSCDASDSSSDSDNDD